MQMPKTSKIEEKIDMQETQPSRIYQHFVLVEVESGYFSEIKAFKTKT